MKHRAATSHQTRRTRLFSPRSWLPAILFIFVAATPLFAQTTITIDRFGVGNAFRPGGPVAVRVVVDSDLDAPVPAIVQWEMPNGDGDLAVNVAPLAIPARGGTATTWLTGSLPSRGDAMDLLNVSWMFRVFETEDGTRTREIASARLSPSISSARAIQQASQMALVIGPNDAGLSGYLDLPGFAGHPGINETMSVVSNVAPDDLSDTWSGMLQYDLLVWAANDPRFAPSRIETRTSIENALRRWIRTGGHLVVLLPKTGDPWRLGRGGTVFDDLFQGIQPSRIESFPLEQALPALSDRPGLRTPEATIGLTHFDPATLPTGWRPLAGFRLRDRTLDAFERDVPPKAIQELRASLPPPSDGVEPSVIYAIRRSYGHGTIDLVGIDVADRDVQLQQSPSLPASWIFWNPLLGRTAFTAPSPTIALLEEDDRLNEKPPQNLMGAGDLVSSVINMSGTASIGVLVGVLLFAVYWVIAGPLGYVVLGRLGWRRYAWPAFFLASMAFAVIAWLLGIMVSNQGVPLQHLTMIRHWYNPGDSTGESVGNLGISWFSTRLPGYSPVEVRIGTDGDDGLLTFFSPPPNGNLQSFPNVSRFEVPVDGGAYAVPARNTSAEFETVWRGNLQRKGEHWESTIKVAQNRPIRLLQVPGGGVEITGTLVNSTGARLRDVLVAIVLPQRNQPFELDEDGIPTIGNKLATYQTPNRGYLLSLPGRWDAGSSLELRRVLGGVKPPPPSSGERSLGGQLERRFALNDGDRLLGAATGIGERERTLYLQMLSLFQLLPPPDLERLPNNIDRSLRLVRLLGQELDLSRHLSEPMLLVLAFADNVPNPIPISIDGDDIGGVGTVLLQWLHPLPIDVDRLVPARPKWFDRLDSDAPEDGTP